MLWDRLSLSQSAKGTLSIFFIYKRPHVLKLFLAQVLLFTPAFYTPASQRYKP